MLSTSLFRVLSCVSVGLMSSLLQSCGATYLDQRKAEEEDPLRRSENQEGFEVSKSFARLVQSESNRPPCATATEGLLIYRLDNQVFEVCANDGWKIVNIQGPAGVNGEHGQPGPQGFPGPSGATGSAGVNGQPGVSAATATVYVFDRNGSQIGFPHWGNSASTADGALAVFLNDGFLLEIYPGTGYARSNENLLQTCYFDNPDCAGACRTISPHRLAYGQGDEVSNYELRKPLGANLGVFVAASAWNNGCKQSTKKLKSSFATQVLVGYPFAAPLQFKLQVSAPL